MKILIRYIDVDKDDDEEDYGSGDDERQNMNHHDGTGRPTIFRTYGDDDAGIAVPDENNN